jgi:hypothetical protein
MRFERQVQARWKTHRGTLLVRSCEFVDICLPCRYSANLNESLGGPGLDIPIHFMEANHFHCRLWLEAVQPVEELHWHI